MTILLVLVLWDDLKQIKPLYILDAALSIPALVALHLHIWDKRFLPTTFWKPYAFVFLAWEFLRNLLLEPVLSGKPFDPVILVVPVLLLPLYIGIFRYAFRTWDGETVA
jgi:hypothetical protein